MSGERWADVAYYTTVRPGYREVRAFRGWVTTGEGGRVMARVANGRRPWHLCDDSDIIDILEGTP